MVIQRSWKILSDAGSTSASSTDANRSPAGLHSSSDDSNCSNQTTHSMVTSVASPVTVKMDPVIPNVQVTDPMKFVTTPFMAESMLQRLRQRYGGSTGSGGNAESSMRSLELLRISVQHAFDKEISEVVKRFMENYFKPAFGNIKENLGQNSVSEEMLQKMSCALLENAKAQYTTIRLRPQMQNIVTAQNLIDDHNLRMAIKRPATKQNYDISNKLYVAAATPATELQQDGTIVKAIPTTTTATLLQTVNAQQVMPQKSLAVTTTTTTMPPVRRQIFWNTAHISTTTKFVLDVQANMAFGFGTDGKERLASKHPELIRYLPDAEDREWLTAQNIIPQQNRNSRFLFLIHEEVCRLQQAHETYRNKTNIDISLMLTFTVPDFMIQKMKLFFVDLNIKSRGLITNSFSIGNTNSSIQSQSNSHLRNALLQGVQSTPMPNVVVEQSTSTDASNASNVTNVEGSISTPTSSLQIKPKSASVLSSSHATLTALLNNSNGNSNAVVSTSDNKSNGNNLRN